MTDFTAADSVIGFAVTLALASRASIRIFGSLSTFLYHCVSEPFTGRRYSFSPSSTNQTGFEIVFPEFLPTTLILIWRYRARRSLRSDSFILGSVSLCPSNSPLSIPFSRHLLVEIVPGAHNAR